MKIDYHQGMDSKDLGALRHAASFLLLVSLASCAPAPSERLKVAVTVEPQAWLVEQIGGDRVDVEVAVARGESPETYQPTDSQTSQLLQAKIYFRVGVAAERGPWFDAIRRVGRVEIVDLRQGVSLLEISGHAHAPQGLDDQGLDDQDLDDQDLDDPDVNSDVNPDIDREVDRDASSADPHIWLSPRWLVVEAKTVTDALVVADPSGADEYHQRFEAFRSSMTALDLELKQLLAPFAGRTFFVFHPAWGYFAAEYGLHQQAIELDGKDPSEVELTRLQQAARRAGTRTIFLQPQIAGRAARAVAEALGAELKTLDPLARDVPANLRNAASQLVTSFEAADPRP